MTFISIILLCRIANISRQEAITFCDTYQIETRSDGKEKQINAIQFFNQYISVLKRGNDITSEKRQLIIEQRKKLELDNQSKESKLIEYEIVLSSLEKLFSSIRVSLLSMPRKYSAMIENKTAIEIETILTKGIHDAIEELSRPISERIRRHPTEDIPASHHPDHQ